MSDVVDDLADIERRVAEKWAAVAAERLAEAGEPFDLSGWQLDLSEWNLEDLPADLPQFPREQWASYPNARRQVLLMCEILLDSLVPLTDEQWMLLCAAMQYGGKTRLT